MFTIVRVLLLTGVLVSGFVGTVSAQETDTVQATVEGFYNWYLGYITDHDTFRNPLVDRAYRESEYLTQDLIERIDEQLANAGNTGIGHDLFLCAQDLPSRYEFEVINSQPGEKRVLLREYFGSPRTNNLTLALNDSEGSWKIAAVTCGDTVTPRGVTEEFYNWYLAQWQQTQPGASSGNPLTEGVYREYSLLTDALVLRVDEYIANRELGWGDPFLCAQDIPQYFWVQEVTVQENTATILTQLYFQNNALPHNLTVTLEPVDRQWQIAEISCGATSETIAALLYNEYAEQVRFNIDHNIDTDILQNPVLHWNRNVSPALLSRLVAEAEQHPMANPVLCAQDIPERFETAVIASSETAATIQISGEFPSGPDMYTAYPLAEITLEYIENQWMLTNITCVH